MRKYEVGKLLEEGVTCYQETVKFGFTQSGPVLLVFLAGPININVNMKFRIFYRQYS